MGVNKLRFIQLAYTKHTQYTILISTIRFHAISYPFAWTIGLYFLWIWTPNRYVYIHIHTTVNEHWISSTPTYHIIYWIRSPPSIALKFMLNIFYIIICIRCYWYLFFFFLIYSSYNTPANIFAHFVWEKGGFHNKWRKV